MKISKKLIASLLVVLTVNVSATFTKAHKHEHDHLHHGEIPTTEEMGIYDDVQALVEKNKLSRNKNYGARGPFLGLPMRYPVYPHPQANSQGAVAMIHNGQPVVLYGPMVAQQVGPMVMGYILQHEYAHHDLGHSRMGTGSVAPLEADADCQAARYLVNAGRMDAINHSVNYHMSQGCNYDPRTPIHMVRATHPCGTQRAEILRSCSASATRAGAQRGGFDATDLINF